jgi:asparagine synthase (glutamine-hydrolysing)
MNDLIEHRGPDGHGVFISNNLGLGHRRLSIIDLSKEGAQPLHYLDKYTITYNGEIYNYVELKEELVELGYRFKSKTDTEVILAAFDRWGQKCVSKFNGMWSFAIFDSFNSAVFCSRDRFGIKPFYYTDNSSEFAFGSEIKQLLSFQKNVTANNDVLLDYLFFGMEEHRPDTFFQGIKKLSPGHNLTYSLKTNTFSVERYYSISIDESLCNVTVNEASGLIRKRLDEAVRLRMRSDVTVGTCLSGGLDSSSIAALSSKANPDNRLSAIHGRSIEPATDESGFAAIVAEHCGLDLATVEPSINDLNSCVTSVIKAQEEPFGGPSVLMQYFVMRAAKENGCTVMLDGQGGDETMFGYESYFPYYFFNQFRELKLASLVRDFISLRTYKVSRLRTVVGALAIPFRKIILRYKAESLSKALRVKGTYSPSSIYPLHGIVNFKEFQKRDISARNLPRLLRYEDKNSMQHSVEARLPFLDYKLVETAVSVSDSHKLKKGYLKYLLREAVKETLPKSIVWRENKFGFEAPTNQWLNAERVNMTATIKESGFVSELLDTSRVNYNDNTMLWRLFNISLWAKGFSVKNS